jgi:hypothetical protein
LRAIQLHLLSFQTILAQVEVVSSPFLASGLPQPPISFNIMEHVCQYSEYHTFSRKYNNSLLLAFSTPFTLVAQSYYYNLYLGQGFISTSPWQLCSLLDAFEGHQEGKS